MALNLLLTFFENQSPSPCGENANLMPLIKHSPTSTHQVVVSTDPLGVSESTASTPGIFRRNMCFLCLEGGRLPQVQTLELDRPLRDCVQDLKDQQLIAELNTASDLVAREAKYYAKCLTALYNRHRDSEKARTSDTSMSSVSLALAELIAFIQEGHVEDKPTVFRLAYLWKLYEARVNQIHDQFPLQARAHSTHLKKRLLQNVPGLIAFNQGHGKLPAL
ncbi:hypothetical protein ElyMa_002445300 [Elysia marginata]|uniref:Uncharacterized protein n=1 Tax=Elysia marginata TaxID=1093978 RepID=A0AAV4GIR3_9GAST|nr:hypothetical protein ElyMa_002445300 [Elysia marginata]